MIQDPGVGITLDPGPASAPWEKDGGQRVEPVQIFPGNVPSAQADTQDVGQRDLNTRRYHSHAERSPLRAVIALSQWCKSREFCRHFLVRFWLGKRLSKGAVW